MPPTRHRGYASRLAAPRRERYGKDEPASKPDASQASPGRSRPPEGVAIPHHKTFAGIMGAGLRMYRSYFDEALRSNYRDAMAVRKDLLIDDALRQRKLTVAGLPWEIVPDDPKDKEQAKAAARVEKVLRATKRFQNLRMYLGEAVFYGKYGAQLTWDYGRVDGKRAAKVVKHKPINGDKIVYSFDDEPGILVHAGYKPPGDAIIRQQDRGRALMIGGESWRDRFIIHEFEPVDVDFLTEGDMAASIHGLGLRSRLWFYWLMRNEIQAWSLDGLEKISTNGQLYGFYPAGNADARDELIRSLQMLANDNVAAFEENPNGSSPDSAIRSIPPSGIAYDVLMQWIDYCESGMRRLILGQSLTSETGAVGMGNGKVAEAHESTFERYIRFDAGNLDETLTDQLVAPAARFNCGDLGFGLSFKTIIDREDGLEYLQKAQILHGMNVPIDLEQLYEKAGYKAPKDGDNVTKTPDALAKEMADAEADAAPDGPPRPKTNAPKDKPPAPPKPTREKNAETSRERYADDKKPAKPKAKPGGSNCGTGKGGFRPGNVCGKGRAKKLADQIKAARATARDASDHQSLREMVKALKEHRRGKAGAVDNATAKAHRDLLATAGQVQAPHWPPARTGPAKPADPSSHADHAPGHIGYVPPDLVHADPERFQFKIGYGANGSVGSLAGVKTFDPDLAGIAQVWRDHEDGKTYVVNGHNRLDLAKKSGANRIAVRYIEAKDAAEARSKGALINIAEGRGTALDAAKFFRETPGLTREAIAARGIPMREKVAQDGMALAALPESIFKRVLHGDISEEKAAAIGGSGLTHAEQSALVKLIDKERKEPTASHIREMADNVRSARTVRDDDEDLFGSRGQDHSLAIHKTKLQAVIKDRLAKEKRLFGIVAKSNHAHELARAGNDINTHESARVSREAAQTLGVFDRLKNLSGPVSRSLNDAAERIHRGESSRKVTDETYKSILRELPAFLAGGGLFD